MKIEICNAFWLMNLLSTTSFTNNTLPSAGDTTTSFCSGGVLSGSRKKLSENIKKATGAIIRMPLI